MPTTTTTFFASEQNQAAVRSFTAVLRSLAPLEPPSPEVVQPLKTFFAVLSAHPDAFDQHCTANIEWIGRRYIGQLVAFVEQRSDKPAEQLIDIFTSSYRILCELEFSQPGDLSIELRVIKRFVEENLESFPHSERQQLVYANYVMPANVAKRLINDSSLADFKAFADSASAAKSLKESWDKELKQKEEEIAALGGAISKLKTQYNFVGLVSGFERLTTAKRRESARSFSSLLFLGAMMLVPIGAQLVFLLLNTGEIEKHRQTLVYSLPILLTLELLLLYFFRVVLLNYRGIKAQLLQLDLRVSLCQFIQSYAEYSAGIKKLDATALARFEALVFSSITSDPEGIPATFDGIEQLTKLVKGVRGQ